MDLQSRAENQPISLDDIATWESHNGMIPQGAVIAVRRLNSAAAGPVNDSTQFPIARDAAEFLIDARETIGFAVETPVDLTALPSTGSLVLVAPAKSKKNTPAPVRILAMIR
jgi:kynurenine formamidase